MEFNYVENFEILTNNLRKSCKINIYDTDVEKEADTMAHSLLDMEVSFTEIINNLLPKLLNNNNNNNIEEEEVDSILLDIGEELRHILYHMKDVKFYKYLF